MDITRIRTIVPVLFNVIGVNQFLRSVDQEQYGIKEVQTVYRALVDMVHLLMFR